MKRYKSAIAAWLSVSRPAREAAAAEIGGWDGDDRAGPGLDNLVHLRLSGDDFTFGYWTIWVLAGRPGPRPLAISRKPQLTADLDGKDRFGVHWSGGSVAYVKIDALLKYLLESGSGPDDMRAGILADLAARADTIPVEVNAAIKMSVEFSALCAEKGWRRW